MLSSRWIWLLAACLFPTVSAADEQQKSADSAQLFRTRIAPLLQQSCLKCHSSDKTEGGLNLSTHAGLLKGGESGPAVDLANPQASLLLQAVRYEGPQMPPTGRLAASQVQDIETWVQSGLPWPADLQQLQSAPLRRAPEVNEETKKHWSFQPIRKPPVPAAASWGRNEIDAFIAAGLQARGLTANPPADPRHLVRRAVYNLTGLPPTPEQIKHYVASPTPENWATLVEQLLQSPHYGEHWARHWLDLVRYAETNSYERDGAKPFAWRYRDYIIDAFNRDLPYDRFLTEQLAGDELPQPTPDSMIATGYYRLGRWDDEPADPELAFFDDIDDIITTTGQTMLGLSINCARCHDHKIDPLPQRDYYRLLAFFRGVRRYGVRSEQSVQEASLIQIDRPEDSTVHAAAVLRYENDLKTVDRDLQKIENKVTADFSGVERDDFQYQMNRVAIVEKRRGTLLTDDEVQRYTRLTDRRKQLAENRPTGIAQALCVKETAGELPPVFVLQRGNPASPAEQVQPGFPAVLSPPEPQLEASHNPATSGRRLALAKWITSPENPLTARVMVNRIWQYHFGRGLVRTSSDFGFQGQAPTHPELLDWLAAEFIARGWSVREMHRLIMNSAVYQFSSAGNPQALDQDPLNDAFWRVEMRRLSAEEIRDSVLAASGALNLQKMFGPSIYSSIPDEVKAGQSRPGSGWGQSSPEEEFRRSIYIHVKRSLKDPLLENFDAADTDQTCPVRFVTTQPSQALGLLNSAFSQQQAARFAERLDQLQLQTDAQWLQAAVEFLLQRTPSAAETTLLSELLQRLQTEDGLPPAQARRAVCLTLLNLNEFLYLD